MTRKNGENCCLSAGSNQAGALFLIPDSLHRVEAAATEELFLKGSTHVEKQSLHSPTTHPPSDRLPSWPWCRNSAGPRNIDRLHHFAECSAESQLSVENCGKLLHLALPLICEDMWGVCVHTYTQLSQREFNHLNFKVFVDFHQKVCGNLEVKYG